MVISWGIQRDFSWVDIKKIIDGIHSNVQNHRWLMMMMMMTIYIYGMSFEDYFNIAKNPPFFSM